MIRVYHQGKHVEMNWGEVLSLLDSSGLPWFRKGTSIYVIGYEYDVELRVFYV